MSTYRTVISMRAGGAALGVASVVVSCSGQSSDLQEALRTTRSALSADGGGTGTEGDFESFYREHYVSPRSFPSDDVTAATEAQRIQAFEQLANIRDTLGLPHFDAQWLNSPNCTSSCSDVNVPSTCLQGRCLPLCNEDTEIVCPPGQTPVTAPGGACACAPSAAPGDGGAAGGDGGVNPPAPGQCAWTSVGPTNIHGRVTGIAIDPTNDRRLFASSVGGVWRSVDGARRWQRVSDNAMIGTASFVAINPVKTSEVFAGKGEPNYPGGGGSGLLVSESGGDPNSWVDVSGAQLSGALVFKLVFDPSATNTIYAATSNGVFTGAHGAGTITWTRLGSFFGSVDDLAIDFGASPPTVYAATESGGIKKWDGANWNDRTSGINTATAARVTIAMAPSNTSVLYARVVGTDGFLQGIYRTNTAAEPPEGGVAWNLDTAANSNILNDTSAFGYAWWSPLLVVDPRSPEVVYAGTVGLHKRTAAGWTNVSSGPDATYPLGLHGDQHALALDPTNPDVVYVGNDGGIYRSTPMSGSWHWTSAAHGMIVTENYQIATQQSFATLVTGGTQSVFSSNDGISYALTHRVAV